MLESPQIDERQDISCGDKKPQLDNNAERACTGKRAFGSEFFAASYADHAQTVYGKRFGYYLCRFCGESYHLFTIKDQEPEAEN